MTDPTRSARSRRGGRRPGWMLLTALLVLAIAASSALVFTNRVELLKLAVILALWAAVVAAFVSVIYRRQSDIDQAKVRDLKLVYDLQLDREISARREYELSLESQLRRELASEVRAQAADEVANLRAELAALRANLEILFDADLSHRPAIETERTTVRAYSDWARDSETTGRVTAGPFESYRPHVDERTEESPIIDVPAEPQPEFGWAASSETAGAHRRSFDDERVRQPVEESFPWVPPTPQPAPQPPPQPQPRPEPVPQPPPRPEPAAAAAPVTPPPQPTPPPEPEPAPEPQPEPAAEWQPAPADGLWLPPGSPGSNWVSSSINGEANEYVGRRRAPEPTQDATEGTGVQPAMSTPTPGPRRGRHSAPPDAGDPGRPVGPTLAAEPAQQPSEPPSAPAAERSRHRSADDTDTAGQSVAELLARLQASPTPGGRRRRREE
ncbi:DUF6779 domain-containing protein [Mycobacterium sp. IS-3022]|uniref:DUF6779 domain-containing protein n=1 Tax=Mycobacterium sp. IS-3022 TaxID=1772277 RepID=UPI00074150A5|nr:DUF6779 domain-containing protein [Mycobacterium sp. IS-3022]KUI05767.1 hypothetical protein AU188_01300 [Mycobacterium sp. IS-3022]